MPTVAYQPKVQRLPAARKTSAHLTVPDTPPCCREINVRALLAMMVRRGRNSGCPQHSDRRPQRKTSDHLTVPSLQVPLNKSMKNLSCPDLTKIGGLQNGGTQEEDIQRAPSLGDSIGETMSLHSDQATEDELQFACSFKNRKLLRTDRSGDDSDSSDCSHLEMMPVSDDDALHTQSDKSSQNDSSSPKLTMKRPAYQPRQRRKPPAPQGPLVQNSASKIPSIKVTCETPALQSRAASHAEKPADWVAVQLTALKHWFAELQDDFSEWRPVEVTDLPPKDDDERFSLKYTKDTLFRFACVDCSLRAVQHECTKLLQWKSPLQTLLVVAALLHGLWSDCLLPLIFLGVGLGLIKNYLCMKGFLASSTEDFFTTSHKKLGIGMGIDKVPAIMSLNMKIAKTFHVLSDAFDKGLSLWTWRKPAVTAKVLAIIGVLVLYSILRPTSEVVKVLGTGLVLKAFLLDYVFVRFPRVRAKYDLAWILWNELPTGPEIEKQARQDKKKEKLSKKKSSDPPLIMINNSGNESRSQSPVSFRGDDIDEVLSSIFDIPTSEMCLPGWEHGRKCTLIKKERSLTSAFRSGRLYLTDHYLLFLRYKTQHPKNLTIPLKEISKLEKGKPSSWISGDGTTLIVTLKSGDVCTFGTVANRDDTFRSIVDQGLHNDYKWASIADLMQSKTS